MDQVIEIVTYMAFVSVSAERFTDVVKSMLKLKFENINSAVYQLIACGFGAVVQWVDPIGLTIFDPKITALLVGLCVSGGSGLWHEVLSFLNNFNQDLKNKAALLKQE